MVYININNNHLAFEFLQLLSGDGQTIDNDIQRRADTVTTPMQLQKSIDNILGRPFHSVGTALLAARHIQKASNSAMEDDPACVAQNVPETFETVEMVRLASHEQVQQQTVEHLPRIFKETAETMRLASYEQVQQQTVEHVPHIFKPVCVREYIYCALCCSELT